MARCKEMVINGKTVRPGQRLRATANSMEDGLCKTGEIVEILRLFEDEDGPQKVFMYSNTNYKGNDNWGSLNGTVTNGHGLKLGAKHLFRYFEVIDDKYVVANDFKYRGKNLKGMSCDLIANTDCGVLLVEFKENIGGGSADGLGKPGHCIPIPLTVLRKRKQK